MGRQQLEQVVVEWLSTNELIAILISLFLNIVISILGIVPSVFLTAANLKIFGFWEGTVVSFLGEVIGTSVSFWLYKKGFKSFLRDRTRNHPKLDTLLSTTGKDAFFLVIGLRLLPFIPSGLVTFLAAVGNMSFLIFFLASTLGKIPAIVLESYSTYQVVNLTLEGKLILAGTALFLILYTVRRKKSNK
ncbi:putative membrane protein YdjX (TVP38/TMEM64 family) [Priestia megaterium]